MNSGTIDRETPYNGCTLCCKRDAVSLMPEENMKYESEPHAYKPGQRMIAHKPNGDCVYLTEHGCSIHSNSPLKCQEMDCRNIFLFLLPRQALIAGLTKVWMRGKELQEGKQ